MEYRGYTPISRIKETPHARLDSALRFRVLARSLAYPQEGVQVKIRFILALAAVIIAVLLAPPWALLP